MHFHRRQFLLTGAAALASPRWLRGDTVTTVVLPTNHREMVRSRKRRIVVQYDANDTLMSYWKLHPDSAATFDRFRDAIFSSVDEPGSQIDAIWWDIAATATGSVYPSKVAPTTPPPLVLQWHREGLD
ncbi:MAG: hypothetical protein ABJF10_21965, partial [Chthoniobacter sp.]|uniref:hypothetical protein n=1 Tax=Chthoniobacter sp. TaxID=2510640 RepID=UPI0032A75870